MPSVAAPELGERLAAFAGHIRDPERLAAPPDVPAARMAVYRELFFNNVDQALAGAFPVLRGITADAPWRRLVRTFFADCRSHEPVFPRLPGVFVEWLEQSSGALDEAAPYAAELARWEWAELELALADAPLPAADPDGDLLDGAPVLSPLVRVYAFAYPVHRIGPDALPDGPVSTFLCAYRDRCDEVGFLEASPMTAALLDLLHLNRGDSGRTLLESIAAQLGHPQPQVVIDGGAELLRDLRRRDVVLGTAVN